MTKQTVLVAPAAGGAWFRADHSGGRWFVHPTLQPFHGLLPGLMQIMAGDGAPDLVISTFRTEELLTSSPDDFNLAERAVTEILCPLGDEASPNIWTWLCYHSPEREPVAGDRFTHKQLVDVLKRAFPQSRLDELKQPALVARRELWVKRDWRGREIAPDSFKSIKLDLSPDGPAAAADAERSARVAARARSARVRAASANSASASAFNTRLK